MFNHRYLFGLLATTALVGGARSPDAASGEEIRKRLAPDEYVAHEWGTFTSLVGSNGVAQQGLHHGDETLPSFVECPLGMGYSRCLSLVEPEENSPLSVTQRMETPVIYFYANAPQQVDVTVDFPQGLISEWYPAATEYSPQAGEVTNMSNGYMRWTTDILTEQQTLPEVSADEIWQAQREVDSNQISVNGQPEQFIFYRGIARFETPFRAWLPESGALQIVNRGRETISAAIVLNYDGQSGAFSVLENVQGMTVLQPAQIPNARFGQPTARYIESISAVLQSHLEEAGLLPLEARAMVRTWQRSYFLTPGLRVLYILPRAWTDRLVPIKLSPAPESLERVFVGRIEVFSALDEQTLLSEIRTAISLGVEPMNFRSLSLGRFAEPRLWRVKQLASEDAERDFIMQLIQQTFQP
jgi:hypothetical protein